MQRYKVGDIVLKELTLASITDFELFLCTKKKLCNDNGMVIYYAFPKHYFHVYQ